MSDAARLFRRILAKGQHDAQQGLRIARAIDYSDSVATHLLGTPRSLSTGVGKKMLYQPVNSGRAGSEAVHVHCRSVIIVIYNPCDM